MYLERQVIVGRGNIVGAKVKLDIFCRHKKEKNINFKQ